MELETEGLAVRGVAAKRRREAKTTLTMTSRSSLVSARGTLGPSFDAIIHSVRMWSGIRFGKLTELRSS